MGFQVAACEQLEAGRCVTLCRQKQLTQPIARCQAQGMADSLPAQWAFEQPYDAPRLYLNIPIISTVYGTILQ